MIGKNKPKKTNVLKDLFNVKSMSAEKRAELALWAVGITVAALTFWSYLDNRPVKDVDAEVKKGLSRPVPAKADSGGTYVREVDLFEDAYIEYHAEHLEKYGI